MPYKQKSVTAVIAAGGVGARMNAGQPKQFLLINDKPILAHTLDIFERCEWVDSVVVVTLEDWIPYTAETILQQYGFKKARLAAGGQTRRASVYRGLLAAEADLVLIHDGVRPFIHAQLIEAVLEAADQFGACSLGTPVRETVKICDKNGFVCETPPRETLWQIQTPQAFRYDVILRAHEAAPASFEATDDAVLVERLGLPVRIVRGSYTNIKITTEEDLSWSETLLRSGKA